VIPGNLSAVTIEGESVILQSFGMLNVELETDTGEALQISKTATLEIAIPDSQLAVAQDLIPLWYFDTDSGLWKEEGVAFRIGNVYRGSVEHFTLWNCDIPFPFVELSGTVTSRSVLPNITVQVTCVETGISVSTQTDNQGYFDGKVPADKVLKVEIIDSCGDVIYSNEIDPLTEDKQLTILIEPNTAESFTVSGRLVCDGAPLSDGYAIVSLNNNQIRYYATVEENGNYSLEILHCSADSFEVIGVNSITEQIGSSQVFPVLEEAFIGDIESCAESLVFEAIYTYNGEEHRIADPILSDIDFENGQLVDFCLTTVESFSLTDTTTINIIFIWAIDDLKWACASIPILTGEPEVALKPWSLSGTKIEIIQTLTYFDISIKDCQIRNVLTEETHIGDFFARAKIDE